MTRHIYLESDVTAWDAFVVGRMALPRPSEQCAWFLSMRPRNRNRTDFTTCAQRPPHPGPSVGRTGPVLEETIVVYRAAPR